MDTQTRTSGADTATLGLGSVLVGSLPAALMTDEAPDRYTVEAVFTRRPERDEITEILGSETRERLAKAGYSTVEVTITTRFRPVALSPFVPDGIPLEAAATSRGGLRLDR